MRERWFHHGLFFFVVIVAGACAGTTPPADDVAPQLAAASTVETSFEAGDVPAARAAYEADLRPHVAALIGARDYVDDYAILGGELDADVMEAFGLAAAGTDPLVQEKVVGATLEWYFFEASYAALVVGDEERARRLAAGIEDLTTFEGDPATVESSAMLVFAGSMRDELGDAASDQTAGDLPAAVASHAEADVYWDMVKDYATARLDAGADVEALEAMIDVPALPSPEDFEAMAVILDRIFQL
jgi:hypothetical protein